ncbi:MAG: glutamine--fructose-6-phosphate transaminase (isomerizing) [Chloroflexi bacterium]|nr:glutamine--fructose-6-phosphate transaminase (isomerizing) [Chloroflexota bacterium]
MCGIVGFVGNRQASPIVLNALKKLEYRGYDSAGIASLYERCFYIKKDIGKLAEVDRKHDLANLPGELAIGHVRWATHGKVTANNAHPHFDCKSKIAVVHNGIIENYQELRKKLEKNHKFSSDTDTEVVCHLIEDYMAEGISLENALMRTTGQLEGTYAIVVASVYEPGKIVGTRRGSPLVVGIKNDEYFIASDALSFLEHTRQVLFLEDCETVSVSKNGIVLFNQEGKNIHREPVTFNWEWVQASKNGYDHYMIKEIIEGSEVIKKAILQDNKYLMDVAIDILKARQVVITACGSSRYASLIGRYLFSKLGKTLCEVVMASEFKYFSTSISNDTVIIAVSQSGETADVLEGVIEAKSKGAKIISIVNVPGSSLTRISDRVLYLNCGPEICVAATKSFIAQLVIFYLLAFAMMNNLEEGIKKLYKLSVGVNGSFKENSDKLIKLAETTRQNQSFYYIARGVNFAMACEGALKLKEISYIHAEGMAAGELKHGTIALVENGTPVVAICPDDFTYNETISNAMETKARGSYIIGVSDKYNDIFDVWIKIPHVEDIFYPLAVVIPLQLMAYYAAVHRGLDPDQPRNLAKSVTVK